MKRTLDPVRLLVGMCILDLLTTLWVLIVGGGAEGNPLMVRFLMYGVGVFIAAKVGLVIVPLSVLAWARRRRPVFVQRSTWFAVTAYVVLYWSGSVRANTIPSGSGSRLSPQEIAMLQAARTRAQAAKARSGGPEVVAEQFADRHGSLSRPFHALRWLPPDAD